MKIKNSNCGRKIYIYRRLITDMGIIVCSLLFISNLLSSILVKILLIMGGVLLFCILFNIHPAIYIKKKINKNREILSWKQRQNRELISRMMKFIARYFYIVLVVYAISFAIEKSSLWIILTCLYWLLFVLYFGLRILCYRMGLD